jgi:protein SCO1/2
MKKIILILTVLVILFSCKHKQEEKDACCKKAENNETSNINEEVTIFDIPTIWTTQDHEKIAFTDIKSKVIIMAMIFTNCQAACPRITADLQRIEKDISKEKLKDVSFVLITMDPIRDTPEQLKSFAAIHQLDLSRWILLTGTEADALEIGNVLNVRFKKDAEGNFDHSNIIHIINNKGNIVHQQIGLEVEPKESTNKINALLKD